MADPVDVELTLGGWIVASIVTAAVTLWGVRYAHRKEVESQRAHEDIVGLYRPLRNEMERILEERYKIGKGWPIMMLGATLPDEMDAAVRDEVMPTISCLEEAERFRAQGRATSRARAQPRKTEPVP